MVCHLNEIFEPKLAYFHKYLSMEKMNKTKYVLGIYNNMSSKIYNILRRYHICIKSDNQRKML